MKDLDIVTKARFSKTILSLCNNLIDLLTLLVNLFVNFFTLLNVF